MNKQRRKALSELQDRIEALRPKLVELIDLRTDIATELEQLRDEEQEACDNAPDSLKSDLEDAAGNLDAALDELNSADLDIDLSAVISYIDDARGPE